MTHRGAQRTVKVDLLAPPPRDPSLLAKVRLDERRIRPRGSKGIHDAPPGLTVLRGKGSAVLKRRFLRFEIGERGLVSDSCVSPLESDGRRQRLSSPAQAPNSPGLGPPANA
ncbi:MAG: hypothetical protein WEA34_01950 [Gemmatimonadota bacterium]